MNNQYDRDLIPVEGNPSLKRDKNSTAVINTDVNSYTSYMSHRERKLKEIEEIEKLKQDVSDIKSMLSLIIEKL
jgi:hypothetical protein